MVRQTPQQAKLTLKRALIVFICAVIAAVFSAFFLDQPSSVYFQNDLEPYMTVRKIARELTDLGYSAKYFALAVVMMVVPWILKKFFHKTNDWLQSTRHWGGKLLLSLIGAGIIIHIFKLLIGRFRPHKAPNFDPFIFEPITTDPHLHSMPSGHSQTIFVLVGILCLYLSSKQKSKWNGLVFLIGVILAFTRVITHQHFLSDCIMGATIGYLTTLAVCQDYDRRWLLRS